MESLQRSTAEETRLLRKIDLHVLPILTLLYLFSFLDRSNIGNAKLDGLTTDLHMTNNQYLWTLTIYFFGYVLFEVTLPLERWPVSVAREDGRGSSSSKHS